MNRPERYLIVAKKEEMELAMLASVTLRVVTTRLTTRSLDVTFYVELKEMMMQTLILKEKDLRRIEEEWYYHHIHENPQKDPNEPTLPSHQTNYEIHYWLTPYDEVEMRTKGY